jgi:hypothetical protein
MPPAIYDSQTMYYATFKKAADNTVLLIPESSYHGLSAANRAYFVSLKELGFTEEEQVTCASLIDWLRSVRRIHTSTEALYKDAVEEAGFWKDSYAVPGCIRADVLHYTLAVKETAAALEAARSQCRGVFGAVAAALHRYHGA